MAFRGDLPGPVDLSVLAVRRRRHGDVDGWRDALAGTPGLQRLGFGTCLGACAQPDCRGMTRAIGDAAIRACTLTAYADVRTVCRTLGVVGIDRVIPVLVTNGWVRWQGARPVTGAQFTGPLAAAGNG